VFRLFTGLFIRLGLAIASAIGAASVIVMLVFATEMSFTGSDMDLVGSIDMIAMEFMGQLRLTLSGQRSLMPVDTSLLRAIRLAAHSILLACIAVAMGSFAAIISVYFTRGRPAIRQRHWELRGALYSTPTVLLATLTMVGWNALLVLGSAVFEVDTKDLQFPGTSVVIKWVSAIIVLPLSSGVYLDLRNHMYEEMLALEQSDFVLALQANGLGVSGPLLRNLIGPFVIRAIGKLPQVLSEVIVIEIIFDFNGVGTELLHLLGERDLTALIGITMLFVAVMTALRGMAGLLSLLMKPGSSSEGAL